ncbi:hypothetical protein F511_38907 [Dorcoceras hygrometricum]|uniref:Uncharacterized protein n=1 Tax=Dorcoceras hygrometricum TaxID=472368 RepID=A0A2Z7D364_9LAMI|nr:hypothetical protein F511_38907 [Dorcoceras hygrometricum]
MPKDKIFDARSIISLTGEAVTLSGLKSQMKMHYRLLCDIMAKSISVKAGSFNAITVEKFSLLTAVVCDVKMNWGRILFGFLKKMVTPGTKQAKGFAIQISLLLESVPNLELGASSEFHSSKILTDKTIHLYIAVIDKSGAQDPADAPKIKKSPKTKASSKKRPADIPLDVPMVKTKRTSKKKSTLKLVAVAQEAIPIQIVPVESAAEPMVEDQQAETEDAADRPATEEETPADRPADEIVNVEGDRVETWFDRALAEEFATAGGDSPTEKANDEIQWFVRPFLSADHDNERLFEIGSDSAASMEFEVHSQNLPVVKDTYVDPAGEQEISVFAEQLVDSVNEEEMQDNNVQSAEAKIDKDEAMSLDDLILSIPIDIPVPSASIEITKIKMGTKIQIPGVDEKLCYLASLPQITDDDKGKALLVEKDPVKGHPAREHYFSICANIDLLVKLREHIIEEVDRFFHYFSFKKLASINVEEMEVKELNAKVDAIALNLELVKRDAEVTKEAILHQIFEFQSQAQANHLILTTQLGQLVEDLNRGGNDKKGEGVSSRGPQPSRARVPVRMERHPLPTREPSPDAQSSGKYLSAEQAAEFENIYQSTSDMSAGSISVGIQQLGYSLEISRWYAISGWFVFRDFQQIHSLRAISRCFSFEHMNISVSVFLVKIAKRQRIDCLRQISRSIISADVFVKRRVSRQLQFPLVPSIANRKLGSALEVTQPSGLSSQIRDVVLCCWDKSGSTKAVVLHELIGS